MPAKKENKINLLPQEEFAASTFGRILAWALGSFRIIVIVTEMIVVVAFLSRFWLDAEASDLNDAIKQKKAIISSMATVEKEFRDAQERLSVFSAMTKEEKPVSSLLNKIISALPSDVLLSSISASEDAIQLKGSSASERSISQFMVNLKSSGDFSEVSLVSADTDTDNAGQLNFGLKVTQGKGEPSKK
jgi:Tfp pilus assembly protein PilN